MVSRLLAGLVLAACLAPAARAEDAAHPGACGGRLLGSVPLDVVRNVPMVAVTANGRRLTMILDTGAERTAITPAAAARIAAKPPRIAFDTSLAGIGGSLATREAELDSLSAGGVALPWHRVLTAGVAIAGAASVPLDGLLGADVLSDFDLDIDLPGRRLGLHERQTCPGARPDWAGPSARIEASRSIAGHLLFHAAIDGRAVAAIVDTGAQASVLAASFARTLGVTDAALARDQAITESGAAGEKLTARVHRFAKLEAAGETFPNPSLVVAELSLRDADLVLGADFLAGRRLWMSYGAQALFLAGR